jgi:hypothetical protein
MDARANLTLWLALTVGVAGCRERAGGRADSSSASLPPVYPSGPLESTHWNRDAGPLLILPAENGGRTAAVVLPEATDSTITTFERIKPPVSGLAFDLFARGGRTAASVRATALPPADSTAECYAWPRARLEQISENWRVGFVSGRAVPIRLDSIEVISSRDSALLAIAVVQTAATLPAATEPTFRGLPFRVRSAYTFRLDSNDVVIADVIRTVNEEANPRVEHIFIIGERAVGTTGKYNVGYYSRTAGSEESVPVTDLLAVLGFGSAKHSAAVVSIEYDDGGKVGLIERTGPGQWSATWRSAYTDC